MCIRDRYEEDDEIGRTGIKLFRGRYPAVDKPDKMCIRDRYILHTDLDADCVHRFYLSENFGTDLGWLADHIVWLSDLLCSQIAM